MEPLSLWLVASKVETPTAVASVVISVPAPLSKYVSLNFVVSETRSILSTN